MEQAVAGGIGLLEGVGRFLDKAGAWPGDQALLGAAGKALERYRNRVQEREPAPAGSSPGAGSRRRASEAVAPGGRECRRARERNGSRFRVGPGRILG